MSGKDIERLVRGEVSSVALEPDVLEAEEVVPRFDEERLAPESLEVDISALDIERLADPPPDADQCSSISQKIIRNVRRGADRGLDVLMDMVTPGSELFRDAPAAVKMKVAQDLLDREGSAPRVQKSEVRATNVHLTGSELAQITGGRKGLPAPD